MPCGGGEDLRHLVCPQAVQDEALGPLDAAKVGEHRGERVIL
jgi:hypothetical protein